MKKILLAIIGIALFSCSKDDNTTQIPTSQDLAYFRGTLNSTPFNFAQNSSLAPTHYNGGGSGFSGEGSTHSHYYASDMIIYGTTSDYPQIGVELDNMYITDDSYSESDAFYNIFNSLPTNFINDTELDNWTKGLQVTYYKADGSYYTSLKGDQTGSVITFTGKTQKTYHGLGGDLRTVTLTGTVKCKLYNYDNPSDVISLNNGSFKLTFDEYLD